MAVISCPGCKKVMAREDGRKKGRPGALTPMPGVTLSAPSKLAPRLKCVCGRVLILLKGSLA